MTEERVQMPKFACRDYGFECGFIAEDDDKMFVEAHICNCVNNECNTHPANRLVHVNNECVHMDGAHHKIKPSDHPKNPVILHQTSFS